MGCAKPALGVQRRIQAELARLGFRVCARTVARYMQRPYSGTPSPGWRQFLTLHSTEIWACDLFTVQTVWFQTLYVFNECLDHRLTFGHHHLQRTVDEFVAYYNRWRPHRSLGQIAPCPHVREVTRKPAGRLKSEPVLGGLHHVYQWAA